MARLRTTRSIAKRIDLGYFKREHPFRRAKRNFSILAALLAAAWPATLAFKDDETIYSGGPMSVRHSQVADSCRDCHRGDFAQRWLHPDRWQADMDLDCLRCHPGPAHHLNQTGFLRGQMAASCSVCHQEHHGRPELSELKSEHCTQCHADLKRTAIAEPHSTRCLIKGDHPFDVQITSFETDHPDFQLMVKHAEGKAADPTKLAFNHYEHLVPDTDAKRKAFQELLQPMSTRPGVGPGRVRGTLNLQCAFCHQPSGDGAYLKPVRYEQHCRECHPLAVEIGDEAARVPHEAPDVVRHFLRSRFAAVLPEGEDLAIKVFETESTLYDADPSACSKCHTLDMSDASPDLPPVLEDTGIHRNRRGHEYEGEPRRWLVHSRFDHNAHRELRCTQCHTATEQSRKTSDLLIPAMWLCKQCHSAQGGARTTCVECHGFHDHARDLGIEGTLRVGEMRD